MRLPGRLRYWLALKVFEIARWYYTGQRAIWLSERDGTVIVRGEGVFVSGKIKNLWLTMFWQVPGRPITELKRVPVDTIKWNNHLREWTFYAD